MRFVLIALLLGGSVQAADNTPCDRVCLNKLADNYVAALVAHDPGKASLAKNVRIVENIKAIQPGEGLWKTASGLPGNFRIYVPDTVAQQVGYMALMQEDGKPIQVAIRLKVAAGKI